MIIKENLYNTLYINQTIFILNSNKIMDKSFLLHL